MFWRKKAATPLPNYLPPASAEPPKPILKKTVESQEASNLRFAGGTKQYFGDVSSSNTGYPSPLPHSHSENDETRRVRPAPLVIVSSHDGPQLPASPGSQGSYSPGADSTSHVRVPSSRRSSRPTSPSTSSFGARVRASNNGQHRRPSAPGHIVMSTPPSSAPATDAGVWTPHARFSPASHVVTTPPSPYRPTSQHSAQLEFRPFNERLPMLGESGSLVHDVEDGRDADVPMLNIIPATPQDQGDGFPAKTEIKALEAGAPIEQSIREMEREMMDISLDDELTETTIWERESVPTIDLDFNFTPLESLMDFSISKDLITAIQNSSTIIEESGQYGSADKKPSLLHDYPPSQPLPPSPPDQTSFSTPSLDSYITSASTPLPQSSSSSSLASFPDVEEALGSMLASLSERNMASTAIHTLQDSNFELGDDLCSGLDDMMVDVSHRTAPLSISTRNTPHSRIARRTPPKLDLSSSKYGHVAPQGLQSAPLASRRNAYFPNARVHPNSSPSGVFTTVSPSSSQSSVSSESRRASNPTPTAGFSNFPASASESELSYMNGGRPIQSYRDSFSGSEISDEELCTASIISVTPVIVQEQMGVKIGKRGDVKKELVFGGHFLKEEAGLGFGLGLGLEVEGDEVGLAI